MQQIDLANFQFFKNLTHLPFIKQILLFGSRAIGDAQERSDIDLAIECSGASEKDWLKVLDIIEDADTLLKIDCVRLDQLSNDNPLRMAILRDGIVLFVRSKDDSKNR